MGTAEDPGHRAMRLSREIRVGRCLSIEGNGWRRIGVLDWFSLAVLGERDGGLHVGMRPVWEEG